MIFRLLSHAIVTFTLTLSLTALFCPSPAAAQTDVASGEADPVKLFERGQDAHARGDFELALRFYEEAVKVHPEFPEAEYQRAQALISLNRPPEAEKALRRAVELRPDWALPYAKLGFLLGRVMNRPAEAESVLRRALELDAKNYEALFELANLRRSAGDVREAIELWRRATNTERVTAATWDALGATQLEAGDAISAIASFDRALATDPYSAARYRRAEAYIVAGDNERALIDLRASSANLLRGKTNAHYAVNLARLFARAGSNDEALKILNQLDAEAQKAPQVIALRIEIGGGDADTPEARAALEKLLRENPRNASLLARLGASYRTTDPGRSLEYYRRAAEIEPRNVAYATGYAAALVQARRFAEAAVVLQRITASAPENYPAHANLATALYELKRFSEALAEYRWLIKAKPDLAIAHYFIATAHDNLGEYEEALASYETFLARADAKQNQLEIDKVNLRLPTLRRQIKLGEGAKRKKSGK